MKKYLIIAIVILFLGLSLCLSLYFTERSNRIRLQGNQTTLTNDVNYYRLKDSSQVAQLGTLNMTVKEFKNANDESFVTLKNRIEAMDIKLRKIENISTAQLTNRKEIITQSLTDTLIFDTIQARKWDYTDKFYTIHALEYGDTRKVSILSRDRMTQVVSRERVGWKFWKRGKLRQTINFENPGTTISYPQYIEIKK
jgi:hypothetical protein